MYKTKNFLIKNYKWIFLIICIIGFLFLVEKIKSNNIATFDEKGYSFISNNFAIKDMAKIAKFISNFAGKYWLIGFSIGLFIILKNKIISVFILLNLGFSALLNFIIKNIIQRPRPPIEYRLAEESGYSFPSGHAMVSMAYYGVLIYLIYKNIKNKYLKTLLILLLSIIIITIGISRIYLRVHYTSDVIAGYLLAISYLIIYISSINSKKIIYYTKKFKNDKSEIKNQIN